ncbi:MAG: L,D-transpeptidase family protein [Anaerosolibacter sp.]|uniref:L,D-transpeptidase family protein n=1 Tax=Anaerosolibacter sp. TaxID=1872527 RepID=UPI0026073C0B|nr:L,D-transpeptidase family protein [Anaerosolibacter sp.]MDF2545927.1 L,D-transpeptidase family protein [Anaerosolibacter sp.]
MLSKRNKLFYYVLIFILVLLQVQVLSVNEVHGEDNSPSTIEEIKPKNTNEDIEVTNTASLKIDSITFDKRTIEMIGTVVRFTAISKHENLDYKWMLFKDFDEIYKKDYSKENFFDFSMNEFGTYQVLVTVKDSNGYTVSKLSEKIDIIQPITIHSVSVDKNGEQPVGTPLTFSVSAEGANLVYHWYIFKDSTVAYDGLLSENNSINYTPNEPGVYKGRVYVRDKFDKYVSEYSEEIIIYEKTVSETERLEKVINETDFDSKTKHFMWVDTDKNFVYVFEGENKNWNLIKEMACTDGKASTPTVKGNFQIDGRAPWLTSYSGDVKAKYKVRFFGNYYFHSILFDAKGEKIIDSRLGESLSHGCVRLSVDDAKWVYDHIKDGTGVYVA